MIEQACEKVYEAITGKCWHGEEYIESGSTIPRCGKCNLPRALGDTFHNPPLATSLDSWRPVWEAMTYEQKDLHDTVLSDITIRSVLMHDWEATPMHHLEAALRMLGEDELAEKVRMECKG